MGGVSRVSTFPMVAGLSWVNSLRPFARESGGLGPQRNLGEMLADKQGWAESPRPPLCPAEAGG